MRALFSGLALVVWIAAGSANAASCDGFTDVDSGAIYCTAITYLKDHGITLGCTGTTYCPNDFVTRAQMALFLQRAGQAYPTNVVGGHTDGVGGGTDNTANGGWSTVAGGQANNANGIGSFVGGGGSNTASNNSSAVVGGTHNSATGPFAFIGSGGYNTASGQNSTVPGGFNNTAVGNNSFAGGAYANANHDGCFVWGDDSTLNLVSCNAANRYMVRALGGIYMFTGGDRQSQYTGVSLAPGASAWIVASDRNGKEEFAAIDADEVLRRVVALPISTWKWKNQDASVRHMGPMAQDFSAAFGLGETPKGISTVDADGVALAAIQGLNAKLEAQVLALTARLAALEKSADAH